MTEIRINGVLFMTVYSPALIYTVPELNGRALLYVKYADVQVVEIINAGEIVTVLTVAKDLK